MASASGYLKPIRPSSTDPLILMGRVTPPTDLKIKKRPSKSRVRAAKAFVSSLLRISSTPLWSLASLNVPHGVDRQLGMLFVVGDLRHVCTFGLRLKDFEQRFPT